MSSTPPCASLFLLPRSPAANAETTLCNKALATRTKSDTCLKAYTEQGDDRIIVTLGQRHDKSWWHYTGTLEQVRNHVTTAKYFSYEAYSFSVEGLRLAEVDRHGPDVVIGKLGAELFVVGIDLVTGATFHLPKRSLASAMVAARPDASSRSPDFNLMAPRWFRFENSGGGGPPFCLSSLIGMVANGEHGDCGPDSTGHTQGVGPFPARLVAAGGGDSMSSYGIRSDALQLPGSKVGARAAGELMRRLVVELAVITGAAISVPFGEPALTDESKASEVALGLSQASEAPLAFNRKVLSDYAFYWLMANDGTTDLHQAVYDGVTVPDTSGASFSVGQPGGATSTVYTSCLAAENNWKGDGKPPVICTSETAPTGWKKLHAVRFDMRAAMLSLYDHRLRRLFPREKGEQGEIVIYCGLLPGGEGYNWQQHQGRLDVSATTGAAVLGHFCLELVLMIAFVGHTFFHKGGDDGRRLAVGPRGSVASSRQGKMNGGEGRGGLLCGLRPPRERGGPVCGVRCSALSACRPLPLVTSDSTPVLRLCPLESALHLPRAATLPAPPSLA